MFKSYYFLYTHQHSTNNIRKAILFCRCMSHFQIVMEIDLKLMMCGSKLRADHTLKAIGSTK